jgi:integrase
VFSPKPSISGRESILARKISICEGKTGGIEIRFQLRKVRYVLAPVYDGRWKNSDERVKAQQVADLISLDMAMGNFDASLSRYKPKIFAGRAPLNKVTDGESIDLLELWNQYTEFRKPSITTTTLNSDYADVKRLLSNLFAENIDDPDAVARWVIANKPPGSARRIIMQLRACCRWALDAELIKTHPFEEHYRAVRKLKTESFDDIDPFAAEERDRIIETFHGDSRLKNYAHLVEFIFSVGCRPSEAIALTWMDVTNGVIVFNKAFTQKGGLKKQTKRHGSRVVRQNEKVKQLIADLRKHQELKGKNSLRLLFPSAKSKNYIEWSNFSSNYWKPALNKVGDIRYRNPYQMKHTFVTLALANGVSIQEVSRHCGVTPEVILRHYAGIDRSFVMPEF